MRVRPLQEVDAPLLRAHLDERLAETMFLASNARNYGLVDEGGFYQGTFLGCFEGEALVGVAQLVNQGSLLVESLHPGALAELARAVHERGFEPRRILGMRPEVESFHALLDALAPLPIRDPRDALLQELTLETLVPQGMQGFRAASEEDTELLVGWKRTFRIEGMGDPPEWVNDDELRRSIKLAIQEGRQYVLEAEGRPVAMALLNASTEKLCQLGGVFTPAEHRGHGHATRLVTAICHFQLSAVGLEKVVLTVSAESKAAVRVYEKIGFRTVGEFRFLLV